MLERDCPRCKSDSTALVIEWPQHYLRCMSCAHSFPVPQKRVKRAPNSLVLPVLALVGLLLCVRWCSPAQAAELRLLEPTYLSLETARVVNHNDQYFGYNDPGQANAPGTEVWDHYTALRWNLNLVSYGNLSAYWNNTVDGASTTAQFRTVSWQWEAGVDFWSRVQGFWSHHSQHVLDTSRPGEHFPLDNWYGVRVVFLGGRI